MATGHGSLFGVKPGTFLKLLTLGVLIRSSAQVNICPSTVANRIDCGFGGINQEQCEDERNCCFDNSVGGSIECFQPDQCENVDPASRTDCGFGGIGREDCVRRRCCYDDNGYSGVSPIFCFVPSTALAPPVAPGECRPDEVYLTIERLVKQWIELFTTQQTVQSVLRNTDLFSISTYCGIYSDTIDNIIACAVQYAGPFFSFTQAANNTFYQNLNRIDGAKSICGAIANRAPGNEVCIAGAVPVCSLLAFDLLATFAGDLLDDISQVCQSTQMIIRSIPTCITLATGSCTTAQQNGYTSVINTFNDIADGLDTYCLAGCVELLRFATDADNAMCSWNVNRFVGRQADYCEYVLYTVECAYTLWNSCPIIPEEYFQNALSVLEPGLLAAGCASNLEQILDDHDFTFNPAFKVPIPACVNAGIVCARELAFAVGVEQLAGPFGGYTLNQVDDRLNIILDELKEGNYQSFCGNPAQRVAQGNPISNCIVDLLDGCGSSANDLQQRLANTAAEWYDEACVPGCTTLGTKLINFQDNCPLPRWFDFDLAELPLEIFLAAAPNGASQDLCRPIRDFAVCIGELIEGCTFLHNRLTDGRNLLVKTITGGREDLPLDLYICGIKLDYPFKPDANENRPFFDVERNGVSRKMPHYWHVTLTSAVLLSASGKVGL